VTVAAVQALPACTRMSERTIAFTIAVIDKM
jgi:hypothetical protein